MRLCLWPLSPCVCCWCIKSYCFVQNDFVSCHIVEFNQCIQKFPSRLWGGESLQYHVIYKDSLTSFPIFIPLIFFSCLIANTLSTALKQRIYSAHPCLVPDFSLFSIQMKLATGFSFITCIKLRYVPSFPEFSKTFIMKPFWIFVKSFCCIYWHKCRRYVSVG